MLELEDRFSTGMAKAAAAAAALGMSLGGLDGSTTDVGTSTERTTKSTKEYTLAAAIAEERVARLKASLRGQARAALDAESGMGGLRRETDRTGHSINQLTGRLRLALDLGAVFGPSLVPIGAVAVPAITGLASQLGFAALGMGSLVVASQGVGEALKAVNDAALEPTAANLEKARAAFDKIGPEAKEFVAQFQLLRPVLGDIRDAAAAGWFPGLTESLSSFEAIAPRVAEIFKVIGEAGGNLIADGAEALAGPEWSEFLIFIEANAPQALDELGRTVGNLIKGMAELWMAFDPLNDDFSSWLLDQSRAFAEWSAGLSETDGFKEFVEYIRTSGPKVADALGAVGNAVLQIVEALAPLGGPSLKIIEVFADAVATIADSDLGTPILAGVAALALYNRSLAVAVGLQAKLGMGAGAKGKAGAPTGLLAGGAGGKLGALGGGPVIAGITTLALVTADIAAANNALMESISSGNLSQATADLKAFKKEVEIDPRKKGFGEALVSSLPGGQLLTDGAGIKNKIEGWFGKSDVEEAEEALRRAQNPTSLPMFGMGNGFAKARAEMAEETRKAEAAEMGLSSATADLAAKLGYSNSELAASVELIDQRTAAANNAFGAETNWRNALKAAGEQAATNNAGIRGSSEAALANRSALESLSNAWLTQRDAMEENGASASQMNGKYRTARKAFIDTAVAMGVPIDQARKLARELLAIPEKRRTDIVLTGDEAALAALRRIRQEAESVPREIRTNYIVTQTNRINKPKAPIPGEYATGGYTGRGGKYDPAGIVHRGEVVIPQELVNRDRDMLKARYGHLSGMDQLAHGGLAGSADSRAELREFSRMYAVNPALAGTAARSVSGATYGPALDRLSNRLERIEKAIHHGTRTNSNEQRENRRSTRKGAGSAGRARSRSVVPL